MSDQTWRGVRRVQGVRRGCLPYDDASVGLGDEPALQLDQLLAHLGHGRHGADGTGDLVTAGPEHPLRFVEDTAEGDGGPRPYLAVRGGMEALVVRSVYYELAERAIADDVPPAGLWSDGAFFPLEPAA